MKEKTVNRLLMISSVLLISSFVTLNLFTEVLAQESSETPYPSAYRGNNYENISIGNGTYVWTGGLTEWVDSGKLDDNGKPIFTPYVVSNQVNELTYESSSISFIFNKNTCSLSILSDTGSNNVLDISYILQESELGSNVWVNTSHNDMKCDFNLHEFSNGINFVTTQGNSDVGIKEIEYKASDNGGLETYLKYHNTDSKKINQTYGFVESITGSYDVIIDSQKQSLDIDETKIFSKNELTDFISTSNKTSDESLEEPSEKSIVFTNLGINLIYNHKDSVHDHLSQITIERINSSTVKTVVDFKNVKEVLPVDFTIEIDPTYSEARSHAGHITDSVDNNNCLNGSTLTIGTTGSANEKVYQKIKATGSNDCRVGLREWNVTSITDGSEILSVEWIGTFHKSASHLYPSDCDIVQVDTRPSTATNVQALMDEINSNPSFVDDDAFCTSSGSKIIDLGSTAVTHMEDISLDDDWFAIAITAIPDEDQELYYHKSLYTDELNNATTLRVIYTEPPTPSLKTVTFDASHDSYIGPSSNSNSNWGSSANLFTREGNETNQDTLLEFNENIINSTIMDSNIVNAALRLYVTDFSLPQNHNLTLHRLLESWTEGNGPSGSGSGVTWNCVSDTNIANNVTDCSILWNGGNVSSTTTDFLIVNSTVEDQWVELDVTNDVKKFLDTSYENHGWLLSLDGNSSGDSSNKLQYPSDEASINPPELNLIVEPSSDFLFNEYNSTILKLAAIGGITDESVVTDYLNQTINELRDDTETKVTDPTAESDLLAILDLALQNVTKSSIAVLNIDETQADLNLNETTIHLDDYNSEILSLNDTVIPIADANFLYEKGSGIHFNSTLRNINATELIPTISLITTSKMMDVTDTTLTALKQTVMDIQYAGFDGNGTAATVNNKTTGIVTFFDEQTSEVAFETDIPDETLAMFVTYGFANDTATNGFPLSLEEEAIMFNSALEIVDIMTTLDNNTLGTNLVYAAIDDYHPSTEHTFSVIGTVLRISIAFLGCFTNDICQSLVEGASDKYSQDLLEYYFPLVNIFGNVFFDENEDGDRDDPLVETGLDDWAFTIHDLFFTLQPTKTSNATGDFIFTGNIERKNSTITIIEHLQPGWIATTSGGIDPEFTITVNDTAITMDPLPIFGNYHELHDEILSTNTDDNHIDNFMTGTAMNCFYVEEGTLESGKRINTVALHSANSGNSSTYRMAIYEGDGTNAVFKAQTSILSAEVQDFTYYNHTLTSEYVIGTTNRNDIWICVMKDPEHPNELWLRATFPYEQNKLRVYDPHPWPNFPSNLNNAVEYIYGDDVPRMRMFGTE